MEICSGKNESENDGTLNDDDAKREILISIPEHKDKKHRTYSLFSEQ